MALSFNFGYPESNPFIIMLQWSLKKFDALSPHELYAILHLRNNVFVVEQKCAFPEIDNKDQQCHHLMGWRIATGHQQELVAYTRLMPAGVSYDNYPSIGRVATAPSVRSSGAGKWLMEKSIEELETLYGKTPVRIGAQLYLKKFYAAFGFEQSSEVYDEDGIDHIEMTRP